jgi:hypothetical protein
MFGAKVKPAPNPELLEFFQAPIDYDIIDLFYFPQLRKVPGSNRSPAKRRYSRLSHIMP